MFYGKKQSCQDGLVLAYQSKLWILIQPRNYIIQVYMTAFLITKHLSTCILSDEDPQHQHNSQNNTWVKTDRITAQNMRLLTSSMSWVNSSLLRNGGFQSCLISLDSDWAAISDEGERIYQNLWNKIKALSGEWRERKTGCGETTQTTRGLHKANLFSDKKPTAKNKTIKQHSR